ncbi:hypothetical protein [Lentilactobacillus sunkii]|uniref:hypothetical protein n=1 Tax=Lentilactobacillus sunkii TaxID=481719 RepID=UPI000709663A|nr:hypothetical protein [Lentilactobacillus sunkii]
MPVRKDLSHVLFIIHIVKHTLRNTNRNGINIETEGVQIASDLYVGISYHNADATATTENRLYTTTKSSW